MAEEITPERAIELSAGEYGEASAKFFANYAVPLFFGRVDEAGEIVLRNGTAFFIKSPKTTFGVTADHVIKACLNAPPCGLFPVNFGNSPAALVELGDIEDRIIDRSERRDIATFRISDDELSKLGVTTASHWPPVAPELKKGVGFCGFPADKRARQIVSVNLDASGTRQVVVSFMPFPVRGIASSISEYQFTFVFNRETVVKTQGFQTAQDDLHIGGMSGGPAFSKIWTPGGVEYWSPAGVVTDGCMNPELGEGRLIAARIDECLAATGTISG